MFDTIPKEVLFITLTLENAGFEAFLVGGCVRDLLLSKTPKDWDITTNAKPEEIISLFPHTFYENSYGTIGIVSDDTTDETLKTIEVTPYRTESNYSDFRRPDSVSFSDKLEDDLKRRDFTVNALAYSVAKRQLIDLFEGHPDLENKLIRAVGNPKDRFSEDALRLLRAVRFAIQLGFSFDVVTKKAILDHGHLLNEISQERVRDEFCKIIMSDNPMAGIELLEQLSLLQYIIPELEKSIGVEQNRAHSYHVWEHLLRSLQCAADKKFALEIRIAALFHDIAKPQTRRFDNEAKQFTFYGHEVVGSRETLKILERLKFPRVQIDKIVTLVRWHMFFSDTEQITLSAVRRMVANVGKENIWDLMNIRICDRIGTGRPKEDPYRLRKYHAMIEEALRDPVSVAMLKINGRRIMEVTRETPGPKIGFVLHALLEEVFDDPTKNNEDYLENRSTELIKLEINELKELGEQGKVTRETKDNEEIEQIRRKHSVK